MDSPTKVHAIVDGKGRPLPVTLTRPGLEEKVGTTLRPSGLFVDRAACRGSANELTRDVAAGYVLAQLSAHPQHTVCEVEQAQREIIALHFTFPVACFIFHISQQAHCSVASGAV